MAVGRLAFMRATVAEKCAGLSDEQLKTRPVPTSELSLIGLVRHLTNMVESRLLWYGGEEIPLTWGRHHFDVTDADPQSDLETWSERCARGNAIAAAAAVDDVGAKGLSLRPVLSSLLYEYERHTGHMDILRELIDGSVGE